MKNQYKVISILASIVLSEGVFAEPSVGELYSRGSSKSKQTIPSTDSAWKSRQQLAAASSNQNPTQTPAELFEM